MQHEGIEVGPVGPHDGPQAVVHANLRKEVGVSKWLEHRAVQLSGEIDVARAAIAEADPEPIVPQHLCGCDSYEVHRLILRQRVDRLRVAAALRADPVSFELAAVQISPLRYEFERTSRQPADEYIAAPDRDHGVVLGVLGVEMGRFVIVEIHRDRDAVEEADPGHLAIMTGAWDGPVGSAPFCRDRRQMSTIVNMANHLDTDRADSWSSRCSGGRLRTLREATLARARTFVALPYDEAVAEQLADLLSAARAAGRRAGAMDAIVAATALAHNLAVWRRTGTSTCSPSWRQRCACIELDGSQRGDHAPTSRFIRFLESFGEGHQGGRLYAESLGDRQQQLVSWVELSGLERVDTLAANVDRTGQLIGAHAPLLAYPPNRPSEDEQVRISVSTIGQEKLRKLGCRQPSADDFHIYALTPSPRMSKAARDAAPKDRQTS